MIVGLIYFSLLMAVLLVGGLFVGRRPRSREAEPLQLPAYWKPSSGETVHLRPDVRIGNRRVPGGGSFEHRE